MKEPFAFPTYSRASASGGPDGPGVRYPYVKGLYTSVASGLPERGHHRDGLPHRAFERDTGQIRISSQRLARRQGTAAPRTVHNPFGACRCRARSDCCPNWPAYGKKTARRGPLRYQSRDASRTRRSSRAFDARSRVRPLSLRKPRADHRFGITIGVALRGSKPYRAKERALSGRSQPDHATGISKQPIRTNACFRYRHSLTVVRHGKKLARNNQEIFLWDNEWLHGASSSCQNHRQSCQADRTLRTIARARVSTSSSVARRIIR